MAQERLLAAFQRAASSVPAYRRLLEEQGVEPAAIVDSETFAARCPILTKANTFDRFPIDQLCAEGAMTDLADVLTSSGHGGRFSFGLSTRRQHAEAPAMIDYALDEAFRDLTPAYARHQLSADGSRILLSVGDGRDDQRARGHGNRAGHHLRVPLRADHHRHRSTVRATAVGLRP